MPTSNKHSVSGQELDNLLKQAFLNLDITNPKNDAIMETVANTTFSQPVVPAAGTGKSFFSAKMIIFGVSLITLTSLVVYFFVINPEKKKKTTPSQYSFDERIVPGENKHTGTLRSRETPVNTTTGNTSLPEVQPATGPVIAEKEALPLPSSEKPLPVTKPVEIKTGNSDSAYVFPVLTADEIKANHKQKKKMIDQFMRFHKDSYAYIPMGSFIYGKDTFSCRAFYMQTTEVSNLEYRTFLFDLLIEGRKQEFLKAKPDQEQWIRKFNDEANMEPMKLNYFSHPAYNAYPVVNISKEGAEMYCLWLTLAANQKLSEKSKPLINDLRIPSDYEWAYAASNGRYKTKYANGSENLRDRRGLYIQNYNCAEYAQCRHDTVHDLYLYQSAPGTQVKPADDGGFLTAAVRSYAPNTYGLYDMGGNVSEMVYQWNAAKNKAGSFGTKGGSWMSPDYFLEIAAKQEFKHPEKPSPFVGFRPVMTALVTNKAGR